MIQAKHAHKRGVAQAVEWVLIIGLSATLTIMVGIWLKNLASGQGEELTERFEEDERCQITSLGITTDCIDLDLDGTNETIDSMDFSNRGSFNILGVYCDGEKEYFDDVDAVIAGGIIVLGPEEKIEHNPPSIDTKTLNSCRNKERIVVVPIIEVDSKEFGCAEKKVLARCLE